jgi:5'-nucleotidase (lipoprotein e(P4) family)
MPVKQKFSLNKLIHVWLSIAVLAFPCCTSVTPAPSPRTGEAQALSDARLDAVLWQTTSAEYRVLAQSIYATAKLHLERALADRQWTALPAQKENFQNLPPAVIMDVDETVIDTGKFQSLLVKNRARFSSTRWREWQLRNEPDAVPGAIEFIAYAESRGVTVFFVTNREHATEPITRVNLATVGVKLPDQLDTVLSRNERPEWSADKTSRQNFIAQSHRVLMLFGDDLADFISEYRSSPQTRTREALKHNEWGTKWFMLPNPMYGSWEGSLYDFSSELNSDAVSKRKLDQLP